MAKNLVPLEDLPPEALAAIRPGTPGFRLYAQQLEVQHQLPSGSLSNARWDLSPQASGGQVLLQAAQDAARRMGTPDAPQPVASAASAIPGSNYAAPPSTRPQVPYNPAEEGGTLKVGPLDTGVRLSPGAQRGLAGVGKAFSDLGTGVRQIFGGVPQEEVDTAARRDAPLMDTSEGFWGNVAGNMALSYGPGRAVSGTAAAMTGPGRALLAGPVTQAAATGAVMGAAAPVTTGQERGGNALLSGAAGAAGAGLAQAANAAVRPAWQQAGGEVARLAQAAGDRYGIPLRAADVSENPVTRGLTKISDMLPFSGGLQFKHNQQNAYNAALARTLGESGDDLSAALAAAKPRLGQTYDTLAARNTALLDTPDLVKIDSALKDFLRRDTSPGNRDYTAMDNWVTQNILGKASIHQPTGKLTIAGDMYKQLRSEARVDAQAAASRGEAAKAELMGKIKETLDGAMRRSATPQDAALYRLTDKQYGNMRTLEKLAPKDATGAADFTRLAAVMQRGGPGNLTNRNAMIYGEGDQTLPELAKIGTTFLGRGAAPTAWGRWAQQAGEVAPAMTGTGALLGGMYHVNQSEEKEGQVPKFLLGALGAVAASKLLGAGVSSQKMLRGAPRPYRAGVAGLAAPLPSGAPALTRSLISSVPPSERPAGALGSGLYGIVPEEDLPEQLRGQRTEE